MIIPSSSYSRKRDPQNPKRKSYITAHYTYTRWARQNKSFDGLASNKKEIKKKQKWARRARRKREAEMNNILLFSSHNFFIFTSGEFETMEGCVLCKWASWCVHYEISIGFSYRAMVASPSRNSGTYPLARCCVASHSHYISLWVYVNNMLRTGRSSSPPPLCDCSWTKTLLARLEGCRSEPETWLKQHQGIPVVVTYTFIQITAQLLRIPCLQLQIRVHLKYDEKKCFMLK